MNNVEKFQGFIEAYLVGKVIKVPDAPTNSQKIYLFERDLNDTIEKLKVEFSEQAKKWCETVCGNGKDDYQKLRPQLTAVIMTVLTNYRYEQEEKSGLII